MNENPSEPPPGKKEWIEEIGAFQYYAHVIADFDPVRADKAYDLPADRIALALVSKRFYEHISKKES